MTEYLSLEIQYKKEYASQKILQYQIIVCIINVRPVGSVQVHQETL